MKYILLILLCFNLVACAEVENHDEYLPDTQTVDDTLQCHPEVELAIQCSLDCASGLIVQDHGTGANPNGVRRMYSNLSDCLNKINVVGEAPIQWVSPGR